MTHASSNAKWSLRWWLLALPVALACVQAGGARSTVRDIGPASVTPLALNDHGVVAGVLPKEIRRRPLRIERYPFLWQAEAEPARLLLWDRAAARRGTAVFMRLNNRVPPQVLLMHNSVRLLLWEQSRGLVDVTPAGYMFSYEGRLNDAGQIAVLAQRGAGSQLLLLEGAGGAVRELATVTADTGASRLHALNNAGEMVANVDGRHPEFWGADGQRFPLGLTDYGFALLNNARPAQVAVALVGGEFSVWGYGDPVIRLWTAAGGLREIAVPGFGAMYTHALNDAGNLLVTLEGWEPRAHLWQDGNGDAVLDAGELIDLTPPGATGSRGVALNDAHPPQAVVVTNSARANAARYWLWQDGSFQELRDLFPKQSRVPRVHALNDRGQILASAEVRGRLRAFLYTPL